MSVITMMKYSALSVLMVVAILWPSASARLHDTILSNLIDTHTRYAIEGIKEVPEPYKTRLTNILQEAKRQHWNSFVEYTAHIDSAVREVVDDADSDDCAVTRDELIKAVSIFYDEEEDTSPLKRTSQEDSDEETKELFDYAD